MTVCDLAAAILVRNQQFPSAAIAKDEVIQSFKRDFPYWSYGEWNQEVPLAAGKAIMKIYESDSNVTVDQIIVELPSMVRTFNNINNKQGLHN